MTTLKFERRKLGERIRLYLLHTGTTQIQLANASGLTYYAIYKISHGHGVSSDNIIALAYFLDIDLRDYVTEIDSETGRVKPRKERQLGLFKGLE